MIMSPRVGGGGYRRLFRIRGVPGNRAATIRAPHRVVGLAIASLPSNHRITPGEEQCADVGEGPLRPESKGSTVAT
jgi:hypothetical protein